MEIIGIELAGRSAEYAWNSPKTAGEFERVTLFDTGTSAQHVTCEIDAAMTALLDRTRPDAVAIPGWADRGGLVALRWACANGVPVVVMSDSNYIDRGRDWLREAVKRRIVRLCSAGLVGGKHSARYLAGLGMEEDRIFMGYDVVDNDHFAAGAAAARADAEILRADNHLPKRYFMSCCRFLPKKNLDFLVSAYAKYRARRGVDAWDLVLLGDGELRSALEDRVAQYDLQGAVHMPGFAQYAELPVYYGLAGAFVLPSTVEQWGLVVNEAMASGLPVLVSNHCGCADNLVKEGKNGFSFSPFDGATLVKRLDDLAHGVNLEEMGEVSSNIIADWSPVRFAIGLERAIACGQLRPTMKTSLALPIFLRLMTK